MSYRVRAMSASGGTRLTPAGRTTHLCRKKSRAASDWVALPGVRRLEPVVAGYVLRFEAKTSNTVAIDITGNQQFGLYLDGRQIGRRGAACMHPNGFINIFYAGENTLVAWIELAHPLTGRFYFNGKTAVFSPDFKQ